MTTNTFLLNIWDNTKSNSCYGNTPIDALFSMACSFAKTREELSECLLKLIKISKGVDHDAELELPLDWKIYYSRHGWWKSDEGFWNDYVMRNYGRWRQLCKKSGMSPVNIPKVSNWKAYPDEDFDHIGVDAIEAIVDGGWDSLYLVHDCENSSPSSNYQPHCGSSPTPSDDELDCDGADTTKSFELDCDAG